MYKGKGGFGMGGGNLQNLMRQAEKLQEQLAKESEKAAQTLQDTILTASTGGGMVTVEMTGNRKIKSLKISPSAVDPDDVEMLEDLVVACLNEVLQKAAALEEELKPNLPNGLM